MSYKDISGQRFTRLTAIKYVGNDRHGCALWLCKCDCGKEITVLGSSLRGGNTKSCGCLNIEIKHKQRVDNPRKGQRLYRIWKCMRQRCNDPNSTSYKNYGGRGITICAEWEDYAVFQKWALSNGYKDNLSIERKEVDGNYCPENCTWADDYTQANNRRINKKYEVDGKLLTVPQIARAYNISKDVVRRRIGYGWDIKDVIGIPVNGKATKTLTYNGETHTIPEWAKITGLSKGTIYRKIREGMKIELIFSDLRQI